MRTPTEPSHADVYRAAVAEALRREYAVAVDRVWKATHCVSGSHRSTRERVYTFGTLAECEAFADGLGSSVEVREYTDADKSAQALHLRKAYRC